MIEEIVLQYLTQSLSDVPVAMEVGPDPQATCVVIQKTGGGMENHISTATLAIQSYAPTLYQAAQLNQQVKSAMLGIASLPAIGKCSLNTDYNFTDTATKRYRYQAVFDLVFYEEV